MWRWWCIYVYFLWAPFSQKNLTQKGRRSNNIVLDRSLWELKADSVSTLCCLSGMNQQVTVDGRICSDNQCIGSHLESFFCGDFCALTLHHSCVPIDLPSFLHNSICQPTYLWPTPSEKHKNFSFWLYWHMPLNQHILHWLKSWSINGLESWYLSSSGKNNIHKESNNPIEFEGTVVINNVYCSLEIR